MLKSTQFLQAQAPLKKMRDKCMNLWKGGKLLQGYKKNQTSKAKFHKNSSLQDLK